MHHMALTAIGVATTSSLLLPEQAKAEPFSLLRTINNPAPNSSDWFGSSAALDGDNILIGAHNDDIGAPDTGSAYLYTRATSVPGPLPLFGVCTAYGFSRKLRRRIQLRTGPLTPPL